MDFERLAIKDFTNKSNQYIYLSARKFVRDYYRENISNEKVELNYSKNFSNISIVMKVLFFYLSMLEEYSDVEFSDNPFVWDDFNFVNEKNAWALGQIEELYLDGLGVDRNVEKAFEMLRLLVKKQAGYETSIRLVDCYYMGYGVDVDMNKAFNYFNELVNDKYKYAYNYLGLCYLNGYGVEKDTAFAYELFKQANKLNQTSATLYNIGLCYEKGYGVDMDINQALEYYQQSSNLGGEKAKKKLEKYL